MLHKNVIEKKCGFRELSGAETEAVSGGVIVVTGNRLPDNSVSQDYLDSLNLTLGDLFDQFSDNQYDPFQDTTGDGGGDGLSAEERIVVWENYVAGQMSADAEPVAYEGRDGALIAGYLDGDKFYADMTGNGTPDTIYIQGSDGTIFRNQGSGFHATAKPWVGDGPFG